MQEAIQADRVNRVPKSLSERCQKLRPTSHTALLLFLLASSLLLTLTPGAAVRADDPITVRVGIYENHPKIFTDDEGNPSGFWSAITEHIAAEEGWDTVYIHGTWNECLKRLQSNEIDVMPDVAYTEERGILYDFSNEIVYTSWSRVYARKGTDIQSVLDLEGRRIAVLKGSVNVEGPDSIKKLTSSFNIDCTFIEVDSYIRVFELVANGDADAGVTSKDFGYQHEEDFNLTKTAILFQPANLYFAFPKESALTPYLIERIDHHLKELKKADDSLYYQSMEKWLGVKPAEKAMIPEWMKWVLIGGGGLILLLFSGGFILRYQIRSKTKELTEEIAERKQMENELRKFKTISDKASYGITIVDIEGKNNYINPAFASMHGYTPDELVGEDISVFHTEQQMADVNRLIEKLNQEGIYVSEEVWHKRKDGTEFLTLMSGTLIRDENGVPLLMAGTAIDITERKQMEDKLRAREKQLSLFFNSVNDIIFVVDVESSDAFRFTSINHRFYEATGLSESRVIGKRIEDVIPAAAQPIVLEQYRKVIRAGQPAYWEEVSEYPTGQKTGEVTVSPIYDNDGNCVQLIGTVHDITERKRMEKELADSEQNFHNSLDNSPLGVRIVTEDGELLYANQTILDICGYDSVEELKNTPIKKLYTPESYTEHRERVKKRKLGKPVPPSYEISIGRKDGEVRHLAVFRKEVTWNGETQFQVLYQDITERKQAEEARHKVYEYQEMDRLKSNLLSTVSHELRTPLAGIKGYASLLLHYDRKLSSERKRESLEAIDRSTNRLTELIDHLLDMSRLDAGLLRLNLEPVNPRGIILSAVKEAQLRADTHKIRTEIADELPGLMADGRRLLQVLDNLLDNAAKYSAPGQEITVGAEENEKELRISVSDKGEGIPADELTRIFDRMYRLEQRLKKDPGGLGLGLSLCKALVEAHGGHIWAESQIGRGSTFYFTLPLGNRGRKGRRRHA